MQLFVNGKSETITNAENVADVLQHYKLPHVRVAVEVNKDLVPRKEFETTRVRDGDVIEIVTLVGGG